MFLLAVSATTQVKGATANKYRVMFADVRGSPSSALGGRWREERPFKGEHAGTHNAERCTGRRGGRGAGDDNDDDNEIDGVDDDAGTLVERADGDDGGG